MPVYTFRVPLTVPPATVTVKNSGGAVVSTGTASDTGSYRVDLPTGSYVLTDSNGNTTGPYAVSLPAPVVSGEAVDATMGVNAVAWDGVTDDTAHLTALGATAVALGLPLQLPSGTGRVTSWVPADGLIVRGVGPGLTIIKQHPSATGVNACTIQASGRSNVTIADLTVDGSLELWGAVATEWKHCIDARAVTGLKLMNVTCRNAKGDGLYIGRLTTAHSSDVSAFNLVCDANYRNGLSIIDLSDGRFVQCQFINQAGTAPQDGVDIEPNSNADRVQDVRFVNCTMSDNVGDGIGIVGYPGGEEQAGQKFVSCAVRRNDRNGVLLYGTMGVEFAGTDFIDNGASGVWFQSGAITDTTIIGGTIARNGTYGIGCQPVAGSTVKNTRVTGTNIYDNGGVTPGTYHGMLWDTVGSANLSIDGLTITNVTSGNRATVNQKYGVYYSAAVAYLLEADNDFRNNATAAAVYNDVAATRYRGRSLGATVISGIAISTTLAGYVRFASCTPTTPITLTLPSSPEENAEYQVVDANGTSATNTITLAPNTGHAWANATAVVIDQAYQLVRLIFRGNKWWVIRGQEVIEPRVAALETGSPLGIVHVTHSGLATGTVTIGTANSTRFYRVLNGGTITKVRINVGVQSGNIGVAAYRNTGTGLAAVPGIQLATSGSIACPAPGINDVALGSSVTLLSGDWLAIGADNTTATFSGMTGGGDSTLSAGMAGSPCGVPAVCYPRICCG